MRSLPRFLVFTAIAIGLLAVAGIFLIGGTSNSHPPEQRVKADFQSIRAALGTYKINAGHYPTTEQGLQALVERPTIPPYPQDWGQTMLKVPTDPWKRDYQYRLVGEAPEDEFELRSLGKDGIEGTKDDQSSPAP